MEIFIGPLIALVIIVTLIFAGIANSNRYDPHDPQDVRRQMEANRRQWEFEARMRTRRENSKH